MSSNNKGELQRTFYQHIFAPYLYFLIALLKHVDILISAWSPHIPETKAPKGQI